MVVLPANIWTATTSRETNQGLFAGILPEQAFDGAGVVAAHFAQLPKPGYRLRMEPEGFAGGMTENYLLTHTTIGPLQSATSAHRGPQS